LVQEQETKQTDYDFIEITSEIKRPTKVTKVKQAAQVKPKVKSGKLKRTKKDEKLQEIEQELETTSPKNTPQEAQAPPTRDLSPVSQMIYEMELKAKEAVDSMPIARRTRSSLGGRNPAPEKVQEAVAAKQPSPSPPKKRRTNVRKKATAATKPKNAEAPIQTAPGPTPQQSTEIPSASRGSRRQVAEMAARLRVTDCIDLVSAVMPRIEGFVSTPSIVVYGIHNK